MQRLPADPTSTHRPRRERLDRSHFKPCLIETRRREECLPFRDSVGQRRNRLAVPLQNVTKRHVLAKILHQYCPRSLLRAHRHRTRHDAAALLPACSRPEEVTGIVRHRVAGQSRDRHFPGKDARGTDDCRRCRATVHARPYTSAPSRRRAADLSRPALRMSPAAGRRSIVGWRIVCCSNCCSPRLLGPRALCARLPGLDRPHSQQLPESTRACQRRCVLTTAKRSTRRAYGCLRIPNRSSPPSLESSLYVAGSVPPFSWSALTAYERFRGGDICTG